MKISLGILAAGTFITWLFFSGLNRLLSSTLPFHGIESESLWEAVTAILSAPATWLAILVVAIGFGLFWLSGRTSALSGAGRFTPLVDNSFGFETINRFVVRSTYQISEQFSLTQTGELNWNILGIISALLVVLILLWLGA